MKQLVVEAFKSPNKTSTILVIDGHVTVDSDDSDETVITEQTGK